MIPWPSSRYHSQSTAVAATTDNELKFLRNQTGHIRNLLARQAQELETQRELLNYLLNEIKCQRDMSNASPMYVFTRDAWVGHRISNVNVVMCKTPSPSAPTTWDIIFSFTHCLCVWLFVRFVTLLFSPVFSSALPCFHARDPHPKVPNHQCNTIDWYSHIQHIPKPKFRSHIAILALILSNQIVNDGSINYDSWTILWINEPAARAKQTTEIRTWARSSSCGAVIMTSEDDTEFISE